MNDRYEDLALRVMKLPDEESAKPRYIITVDGASFADRDIALNFEPPFGDSEIYYMREMVERTIETHVPGSTGAPLPERDLMQEMGRRLFDALMSHNDLRIIYSTNLARAIARGGKLRIRLRMDQTLANLPCEFLFGSSEGGGGDRFLVTAPNISLVRYVPAWRSRERRPIKGPMRLLMVIANPRSEDYHLLDTDAEKNRMESSLQPFLYASENDEKLLEIEYVEGPLTLHNLSQELGNKEYHVIHYIGHGDYDENTDRVFLALEGQNRQPFEADGDMLVDALDEGMNSLRLVTLNCCRGAIAPTSKAFAGVALSLVRSGIPAVIAMQFEVTDLVARLLSEQFYTDLMRNGSVDDALSSARRKLINTYVDTIEWATPVLYLGTISGVLFDIPPERVQMIDQIAAQLQELERLYELGQEAYRNDELENALMAFKQIAAERDGFRGVPTYIKEIETKVRRKELYGQAQSEMENGAYRKALTLIQEIERLVPDDEGVAELRAQVQPEVERLGSLFSGGTGAVADGDFQQALTFFSKLEIEDPDYPELREQLNTVRSALQQQAKQFWNRLVQKRAVAMRLEGDRSWEGATQEWKELESMANEFYQASPRNTEARSLWEYAEAEVNLGDSYQRMRNLYDQQEWAAVIDRCVDLLGIRPSYRDVDEWRKKAADELRKTELQKQREEEVLRKKLPDLYARMRSAEKEQQWEVVISTYREIEQIDPNYRSAAQIANRARGIQETAGLIRVATPVTVEEMYEKAREARRQQKWPTVIELCHRVLGRNPEHQGAIRLQKEAQEIIEVADEIGVRR